MTKRNTIKLYCGNKNNFTYFVFFLICAIFVLNIICLSYNMKISKAIQYDEF